MDLNKIALIGRLTKDPETKELKSNQALTKFSLATNRTFMSAGKKKEDTTFFNVIAWGKLAEIIEQYLKKGDKVYIEGRVNNRSYEDKEGKKKYISEVVATQLIMLGGKKKAEAENASVVEEEVDLEKVPF